MRFLSRLLLIRFTSLISLLFPLFLELHIQNKIRPRGVKLVHYHKLDGQMNKIGKEPRRRFNSLVIVCTFWKDT